MTRDIWGGGLEPGSFLAELSLQERTDLERRGRLREFQRGDALFTEGEESTWVAVLLAGRVKAYSYREQGGEALLAVYGPGALLGETAAIDGRPRSATLATLEPVRILALTARDFTAFLQTHGRVSLLIMQMLTHRWQDAERKRLEFGVYDVTGRLASRLVELAERFGAPDERRTGSVRITINLSQEELAGWAGTSREAVSKALRTMRAHGWIETGRRRLIIHDLEALRRHAR